MTKKIYTPSAEDLLFINSLAHAMYEFTSNEYHNGNWIPTLLPELYRITGMDFIRLGYGAYAHVIDYPLNDELVIKIGASENGEDGWIDFAGICMLFEDDDRLPGVYHVEVHDKFYIALIERLEDSSSHGYRYQSEFTDTLWDAQALLGWDSEDEYSRTMSRGHFLDKGIHEMIDMPQVVLELCETLEGLNNARCNGASWDLHTGNWMFRGCHEVITDPFAHTMTKLMAKEVCSKHKEFRWCVANKRISMVKEVVHATRRVATDRPQVVNRFNNADNLLWKRPIKGRWEQRQVMVDEMFQVPPQRECPAWAAFPTRNKTNARYRRELQDFANWFAARLHQYHPQPGQALAILRRHIRGHVDGVQPWMVRLHAARRNPNLLEWDKCRPNCSVLQKLYQSNQAEVPHKATTYWDFVRVEAEVQRNAIILVGHTACGRRYTERYPIGPVCPVAQHPRHMGKR